jgi:hypothetical protein
MKAEDWASNVNLLLPALAEREKVAIGEPRANPLRWARAADTFLSLVTENWDTFKRKPDAILQQILSEGKSLNEATVTTYTSQPDKYMSAISSLVDDYNRNLATVLLAINKIKSRVVQDETGVSSWLEPGDLRDLVNNQAVRFTSRDIIYADTWPVIEMNWPDLPMLRHLNAYMGGVDVKSIARGKGGPLAPLKFNEKAWQLLLSDPTVPAAELIGLGQLHLRYFPDVFGAIEVEDVIPNYKLVWGEPTVTLFAYVVGTPGVVPKHPIAMRGYRSESNAIVYSALCARTSACKYRQPASGFSPNGGTFDWAGFLAAIVTDMDKQGSELYQAIDDLDGTVTAIRGTVALTLPGPSLHDDDLRSILYGYPDRAVCWHAKSRVETQAIIYEADTTRFKDQAAGIGLIDGVSVEPDDTDKDQAVKDCSDESNTALLLTNLLDRKVLRFIATTPVNGAGTIVPQYLNRTNFLETVEELGRQGSDHLLKVLSKDLAEVKSEDNYHSFLKYQIDRLESLSLAASNK